MNNKPKHTPGPWKVTSFMSTIENDKNVTIATPSGNFKTELEFKANARLIATAPELLETINLAKKLLESNLPERTKDAIEILTLAAAKAEGV